MPGGLQVWNPNGALVLDTSVRVAKHVGSVNTGTTGGSIWTDTSKGTPWAYAVPLEQPQLYHLLPDIWFDGNTLNWSFGNVSFTSNRPVLITYGYF